MNNLSSIGSEFFLISAISESPEGDLRNICTVLDGVASVYELNLPEFKVGTLDTLIGLSDDLARHDLYSDGFMKKAADCIKEVLGEDFGKIVECLVIAPTYKTRMDDFVKDFTWDIARYQIKQPLRTLVEHIVKQLSQIERDLKIKSSHYYSLRNQLGTEERKMNGSIVGRSLYDIVKKDDFVVNSEYMVTLLVVVQKLFINSWWSSYESLCAMVVPNSSKVLYDDSDHYLVNVTVFRKFSQEFKEKAKQNRFIVRDFEFDEEKLDEQKQIYSKLCSDRDLALGALVQWLRINFSESFIAWIHLKGIRLFVESVLRFGLPTRFQYLVVHPLKKNASKLKDILVQHYGRKGSKVLKATGASVDLQQYANSNNLENFISGQNEIHPFICMPFKTTFYE